MTPLEAARLHQFRLLHQSGIGLSNACAEAVCQHCAEADECGCSCHLDAALRGAETGSN